jgi:hypothetical protein
MKNLKNPLLEPTPRLRFFLASRLQSAADSLPLPGARPKGGDKTRQNTTKCDKLRQADHLYCAMEDFTLQDLAKFCQSRNQLFTSELLQNALSGKRILVKKR